MVDRREDHPGDRNDGTFLTTTFHDALIFGFVIRRFVGFHGCMGNLYTDKSSYAGDVGYAITIDLNNEMIVELEDIIEDEGRNEIKTKIEKGEFETESGVITSDNKYIDVNSIIDEQPAVNSESEESQYYFFLRDKKIGIIIIGLPRYGGNYSIINVNYS